ncbi:hypothetical protein WJX72_003638 [[Myrmecia] bisecta]|uniref:Uncharacterized protein n=1 Tax=[Myrmecia] bisecta TaxID=41462 RepID=A0AAW1R5I8_9CHLO
MSPRTIKPNFSRLRGVFRKLGRGKKDATNTHPLYNPVVKDFGNNLTKKFQKGHAKWHARQQAGPSFYAFINRLRLLLWLFDDVRYLAHTDLVPDGYDGKFFRSSSARRELHVLLTLATLIWASGRRLTELGSLRFENLVPPEQRGALPDHPGGVNQAFLAWFVTAVQAGGRVCLYPDYDKVTAHDGGIPSQPIKPQEYETGAQGHCMGLLGGTDPFLPGGDTCAPDHCMALVVGLLTAYPHASSSFLFRPDCPPGDQVGAWMSPHSDATWTAEWTKAFSARLKFHWGRLYPDGPALKGYYDFKRGTIQEELARTGDWASVSARTNVSQLIIRAHYARQDAQPDSSATPAPGTTNSQLQAA